MTTTTSYPEPLQAQQPTRTSEATQSAPSNGETLAKSGAGDALGSMVQAVSGTDEQRQQQPPGTMASAASTPAAGQPPVGKEERSLPTSAGFLTILSDSVSYHVKHPLQSHWTLHQKIGQVEGASSRGVSQDDWERSLKKSVTIGTVEDFWCVYNSMQDFSTIPNNCDYFFMREDVKPMWEDPANKGGCELRIVVTRNMDALLATVGAQFSAFEVVTGVQFAFRSTKNRISVWLAAASAEARERLRTEFGDIMERASSLESAPSGGGGIRVEINEFSKTHDHHGGDRGGSNRGPSGRAYEGGDHHGRRGPDHSRGDRDRGDRNSVGGGNWANRGSGGAGGGGSGAGGRMRDYR